MLLGKKAIRAENCNHFQPVCLANCMHRGLRCIDWWLRRSGGGEGGAGWCRMRAVYSGHLIKTNISDPDPPLSSSYQLSLYFRDAATNHFSLKWRVKKVQFSFHWKYHWISRLTSDVQHHIHQTIVCIKLENWPFYNAGTNITYHLYIAIFLF